MAEVKGHSRFCDQLCQISLYILDSCSQVFNAVDKPNVL